MDEIELLVNETFKHFDTNFGEGREMMDPVSIEEMQGYHQEELPQEEENEFPEGPGIIYHVQKTKSVFVVRTFVSQNIRQDYVQILEKPEDYPSLRLLEGGLEDLAHRLKFFIVEEASQA